MPRNLRLLFCAALIGLGACKQPSSTLPPSDDPNVNKVMFSQPNQTDANTADYTSELVSDALALAPGDDFLTINVPISLSDSTRLVHVELRAPSNHIKAGASFPLNKSGDASNGKALYIEQVSSVVTHQYQATSGTLTIDKITGTTSLSVEFHIKDAKMEPDNSTNGVLGAGSFLLNLHGIPSQ
jgi:hypothetical protein